MNPSTVDAEEFAAIVERIRSGLPAWIGDAIRGVAILVDDLPDDGDGSGGMLLGRFHGIPRTAIGDRVPGSLPDVITLYRIPILRTTATPRQLEDRVRAVLLHEIGHALGMSERRLRDLGVT